METQKNGLKLVSKHLFPHEKLLESLQLSTDKLNDSLQEQIELFDRSYYEAYYDGILDEQEEAQLARQSNEIVAQIKKEYGIKERGSGGIILGVLGGIGLGVLAFFGIKRIIKL